MDSQQLKINLFPFLNKHNVQIMHDDKQQPEKVTCFEYTSDFTNRTVPEFCTLNRDKIGYIDISNNTNIDISFGSEQINACAVDEEDNITTNCKQISNKLAFNIDSLKISGKIKEGITNDNLKVDITCDKKKVLESDDYYGEVETDTTCNTTNSTTIDDWISDSVDNTTNIKSFVKKLDKNKFSNCERLKITVNDDVLQDFRIDEINTTDTWINVNKISNVNNKKVGIQIKNDLSQDPSMGWNTLIQYKTKGKSIKQINHLLPKDAFRENYCLYNGPLNNEVIEGQNVQVATAKIAEECVDQDPGTWKSTNINNEDTATIYFEKDIEIKDILIDKLNDATASIPTKVALICDDTKRKDISFDTSAPQIPRILDVSSDKFVCKKLQIKILQSANKNDDGTIKFKSDNTIDESNDHAFKLLAIMANVDNDEYELMKSSVENNQSN